MGIEERFHVRYVELSPKEIFNTLDPMNQQCAGAMWNYWGSTWWESATIQKRIFFKNQIIKFHDEITKHFSKLEQSIKDEGILYPINIVSGPWRDKTLKNSTGTVPDWFPPEYIANPNKAIYCHTHGGSRLLLAEKLGIEKVPCAVHDFSNLFPSAPIINEHNFTDWYGNDFRWNRGMNIKISNKLHHHLKDNKTYKSMNSATRVAQSAAHRKATEATKQHFNLT